MSPVLKSKSKDKSSAKAAKEQSKASSKTLAALANGGNVSVNAFTAISGTFHVLDTVPSASSPPQNNGRFHIMEETEDCSGSSLGTAAEYDSVSNNDSCSGESEDHKDKATTNNTSRPDTIPGCDTDKRDKIRQKNEKKHQRQKEKRALELHERCIGFLMSRKLDTLTQQLVTMGFPAERATAALMLNEGRVEDSVSWLFEGGIEEEQLNATKTDNGVNLKIDISDELAKIAEMEIKFKCTKQEVERAVVNCEGNLEKAAEILKSQKQEQSAAAPKQVVSSDPSVSVEGMNMVASSTQNPVTRIQGKPAASVTIQQARRDEGDLNHSKVVVAGSTIPECRAKTLQPLIKIQSKTDWAKPQVATQVDKRWPSAGTVSSISYSLASPMQVAAALPVKDDARHAVVSSESRMNFQPGMLREPVIVMQRPQSISAKQNQPSTSAGISALPPVTAGWNTNGVSSIDMLKIANGGLPQNFQSIGQTTGSLLNSSQPFYQQNHHHSFVSAPMDNRADTSGWGSSSWNGTGTATGTTNRPSSLTTPSSLGLFTGWGSTASSGSSSPVDWSTGGSMQQFDYTSIDWSLDSTPLVPSDLPSHRSERLYDTWSTSFMGVSGVRSGMSHAGDVRTVGLQEVGGFLGMDPLASLGSREWTSPFAGKDIFRVPRQFVTSPTL